MRRKYPDFTSKKKTKKKSKKKYTHIFPPINLIKSKHQFSDSPNNNIILKRKSTKTKTKPENCPILIIVHCTSDAILFRRFSSVLLFGY